MINDLYSILESKTDVQDNIIDYNMVSEILSKFEFDDNFLEKIDSKILVISDFIHYLLDNEKVEMTQRKNLMALLAVLYIISREEENSDDEEEKSNIRYILEELKLNGIGNGLVKKLIQSLYITKDIYNNFYEKDIESIFDFLYSLDSISDFFFKIVTFLDKKNLKIDDFIVEFGSNGSESLINLQKFIIDDKSLSSIKKGTNKIYSATEYIFGDEKVI